MVLVGALRLPSAFMCVAHVAYKTLMNIKPGGGMARGLAFPSVITVLNYYMNTQNKSMKTAPGSMVKIFIKSCSISYELLLCKTPESMNVYVKWLRGVTQSRCMLCLPDQVLYMELLHLSIDVLHLKCHWWGFGFSKLCSHALHCSLLWIFGTKSSTNLPWGDQVLGYIHTGR